MCLCDYLNNNRVEFLTLTKMMKFPIKEIKYYLGTRLVKEEGDWDRRIVYFELGRCRNEVCYGTDALVVSVARDGFVMTAEIIEAESD